MATMTEAPETVGRQSPSHDYNAEAQVLSGHLHRPIEQKIEPQAPVKLNDRRGGHFVRNVDRVSIEGLISFAKGETRVSGARSMKTNGWVTVSTSILEGLNVFEVIAAERIVSQLSTEHPVENGHIPHVTFLGTQFSNFRVGGFPVTLTLNLGICGDRPSDDRSYLRDSTFLSVVKEQTGKIAGARGLPKPLKDQYDEKLAYINQLITAGNTGKPELFEPKVTCSLVQSIGEIPIPGVQSFGHILVIPDFGSVALGEVEVGEKMYEASPRPTNYFELTMLQMKLGCVGDGNIAAGKSKGNGQSYP